MAVSASLLTTGGSNTAVTSIATASITPTANRLVAVYIVTDNGAPTSLSGNGLTWVQEILDTTLVPITVWRSMGASPSAGAITINLAANSVISWVVIEYDGVDTSGTNGSGAIVASQDSSTTGSAVTSLTVTLPAGVTAGNAVAAMFINGASAAMTAGGSYTKLGETTASGFVDQAHEWAATGTTTPSMSWTGSANAAGLAIEIVAAAAAGAADQSYRPDPLSVVRYRIPALRGLRTFTSELTTVPPAASGSATDTDRTSGTAAGVKGAIGAAQSGTRVSGQASGIKGAAGASSGQQRTADTTAAAKQTTGAATGAQRSADQSVGKKGAIGSQVGEQRTNGVAVRGVPPAAPAVGEQRVSGITAGKKAVSAAAVGEQHTAALLAAVHKAAGAATGQLHSAAATAGTKAAQGTAVGQQHSSGIHVVAAPVVPGYGIVTPAGQAISTTATTRYDTGSALLAGQATSTIQAVDHDTGTVHPAGQAQGEVTPR